MRLHHLIAAACLCAAPSCRDSAQVARLPASAEPARIASTSGTFQQALAPSGTLVLSGTLEPHRRATLMPRVGGPVVKVHVREGDVVKAGDPLVSIDPEQFGLVAQQAETGLEGAQLGMEANRVDYERQKALFAQKALPQAMFEMVEVRYRGSQVAVKAAEVGLAQARKAQRDATVRAPFGGVVTRKHVCEGDMATAMPPTQLITMEENGILDLRIQVPAAQIARARVGEPVTVRFPSGHRQLDARISRVVASINPGTRTLSAFVEIDNAKGEYVPGLFAEATLGASRDGERASDDKAVDAKAEARP